MGLRHLLVAFALATGACSTSAPPLAFDAHGTVDTGCSTGSARISFDFEAASPSRCVIEGESEFTVLVSPEHYPPINPSPWYAFRYEATGTDGLTVHLRYLGGEHRYAPNVNDGSGNRQIPAKVSEDGRSATLSLPPGKAIVSAQEIVDQAHYRRALERWAASARGEFLEIGRSHDSRPIEAVRIGRADAPRLVVLIGRQHPPEVTGAIAMEAFVDRVAELMSKKPGLNGRYQFIVIPMLNPDGVARGHWRANLGGRDLNRDWGDFSQPETQAVRRWLDALPDGVTPVLMLDFHSTFRNLFYVQGEEAGVAGEQFLAAWLGGKEQSLPGYPFTIERRNANPGSGTTKNWFHATYGIPAYTYEVGDQSDRAATRNAAKALADALPQALAALLD